MRSHGHCTNVLSINTESIQVDEIANNVFISLISIQCFGNLTGTDNLMTIVMSPEMYIVLCYVNNCPLHGHIS